MILAEDVTFGSSGLDRAAILRAQPDSIAGLLAAPDSRAILLWRGKPLVSQEGALVRLPLDHVVLRDETLPRIFLGLDDGSAVFAFDFSKWQPEGDVEETTGFLDRSEQSHPDLPLGVFAELRGLLTKLGRRDAELAVTAKAVLSWHDSHQFCAKCGASTDMVQEGWQRSCPACGGQHFPRTDPVVIMLITRGNRALLGRSPGWPEGMFSCLAGFVEPGETIEAAVRRETLEEAGVTVGPVRYLSSQPWPFPASLMLGCHGEATSDSLRIDPDEIEEALWISREELADAFAGVHPKIHPARKGSIAHFLLQNWLSDRLD